MGVLLARTTDLLHDIGNNGLHHGSLRNRKLDTSLWPFDYPDKSHEPYNPMDVD